MRGDEEGEFTFMGGKGKTVINYVIESKNTKEKLREMKVGCRVDSEHQLIEIKVKGKEG